MAKFRPDLPARDDLLRWLEDNPGATRRDAARAFALSGAAITAAGVQSSS